MTALTASPWPAGILDCDVDTYTTGECWYLALTLSRWTSWPMVFVADGTDFDESDWCHALVRRPDGYLVDVRGLHDPADVLREWGRRYGEDAVLWEPSAVDALRLCEECDLVGDADFDAETAGVARILLSLP